MRRRTAARWRRAMRTALLFLPVSLAAIMAPRAPAAGDLNGARFDEMVAPCLAADRAPGAGLADQQSIFDAGAWITMTVY